MNTPKTIVSLFILLLVTIFLSCKPSAPKTADAQEQVEDLDQVYEMLPLDTPITTIVRDPNAPSVEDSVRLGLGEKLYFSNTNSKHDCMTLEDSITVIGINHYYSQDDEGWYHQYRFIVHNKHSIFHKPFTVEALTEVYRRMYDPEDEDYEYYEAQNEFYNEKIANEKVGTVALDDAIAKYDGFWIYIDRYDDEFYIEHDWSWLPSFKLEDGIWTSHYMDGPYPYVIEGFKKHENGDFELKKVSEEKWEYFKLVDAEREVYQIGTRFYVTPARNVYKFEIIEYANNTGDLMVTKFVAPC